MPVIVALALCTAPIVIDGDGFRCRGQPRSMRLSGIDAPEMPGHCRPGRVCAPGDPYKARDALAAAMAHHRVRYRVLKIDRYGRNVVLAYVRGRNLSCSQLAGGNAVYKPQWDHGGAVKRECLP